MRDPNEENFERLQHIAKAISDIQKYVLGETSASFCENDILHDAVLLQFIIIGEAITHVENEILEKYDYPWYKVRSFRNMIAHEYFNIKLVAVWEIIANHLPALKAMVDKIIEEKF
ncbi:MAG: HepT-like ribonuclease domain-containing protein [Ferruginibacter sp.]